MRTMVVAKEDSRLLSCCCVVVVKNGAPRTPNGAEWSVERNGGVGGRRMMNDIPPDLRFVIKLIILNFIYSALKAKYKIALKSAGNGSQISSKSVLTRIILELEPAKERKHNRQNGGCILNCLNSHGSFVPYS